MENEGNPVSSIEHFHKQREGLNSRQQKNRPTRFMNIGGGSSVGLVSPSSAFPEMRPMTAPDQMN